MITLYYVCHRCDEAIRKERHAEDAFLPLACSWCGNEMTRSKPVALGPPNEKKLLESWPAPRCPDPDIPAA